MRAGYALLATALLVALVSVAPTSGFSTMQAERGVSIDVAPDSSAYVGLSVETNTTGTRARTSR